ncbi:MAG: NAD(P)-dependent oxidoreductase, partial [Vicinamibacterales bacterium]
YWPVYQLTNLMYVWLFKRNPKLPVTLIPVCVESRLKPLRFTNRKAVEMLGWKPPLSHRECLDKTFGPVGASAPTLSTPATT